MTTQPNVGAVLGRYCNDSLSFPLNSVPFSELQDKVPGPTESQNTITSCSSQSHLPGVAQRTVKSEGVMALLCKLAIHTRGTCQYVQGSQVRSLQFERLASQRQSPSYFLKVSYKTVTTFPQVNSPAFIPIISETKPHKSPHKSFLASRDKTQ